jgi:hypothetical protein
MEISQKLFIIEPVNGMCNRLRAIASGWILSRHMNRKFAVLWKASEDIGFAKFTDLFEYQDWLLTTDDQLPHDLSIYVAGIQKESAIINRICNDKSNAILLKQTGGNYMPPGIDISNFNTLKSQFYNSLTPVKEITDIVYQFTKSTNIDKCIGVHIRRTDRRNLTPSTEMFALAIKRYDTSEIYLCTDDQSEIAKLKKLVAHKIVTYPKQRFSRNMPESIKDALIEWLLLSKCKNVIYSHGSSFGYEACVRGRLIDAFELRTKREKNENEKRNLPNLEFE